MSKKNGLLLIALAVVVVLGLFMYLGNSQAGDEEDLLAKVQKGEFKIEITTSGELEAKNSTEVKGHRPAPL